MGIIEKHITYDEKGENPIPYVIFEPIRVGVKSPNCIISIIEDSNPLFKDKIFYNEKNKSLDYKEGYYVYYDVMHGVLELGMEESIYKKYKN